jgi:hypothetical protein
MSNISKKLQQVPNREGRGFSDYTQLSPKLQAILLVHYQGNVGRTVILAGKPLQSVTLQRSDALLTILVQSDPVYPTLCLMAVTFISDDSAAASLIRCKSLRVAVRQTWL